MIRQFALGFATSAALSVLALAGWLARHWIGWV